MRKFLVVLLILAVAGGAFAQEETGSTWSAWSGGATLGTTIDFWNDGNMGKDNTQGKPDPVIGMYGLAGGISLNIRWDYVGENWSIALPLYFEGGDAGIKGAEIAYSNGPVSVSIPITMKFAKAQGVLPIEWEQADILAKYTGENFEFKLGVKDLLNVGDDSADGPSIGPVGGRYLFNGGAELVVSYNNAYATPWWRASDYTINAVTIKRMENNGTGGGWNWFEDLSEQARGDDDPAYGNGLAFRYILSPALNFGIAFAGGAGDAMFFDAEEADPGAANFLTGFLYQPTIGMRYESDFGLDVGFMLGIRNYSGSTANWNGAKDNAKPKKVQDGQHFYAMVMHASAAFALDFGLTIKGDVAALIDFQDGSRVKTDKNKFGLERNTAVYYGVGVDFAWSDLTAGLVFTGLDTTITDNAFDDLIYGQAEAYAYKHGMKLTLGYNDGGKGIGAGAYLGISDFGDLKGSLTAGVSVGYLGLAFGSFELGVTAAFDMKPDADDDYEKTDFIYGFLIKPVISWNIISNGSIDFSYSFGATHLLYELDISKLGVTFKWKF